MKLLAAQHIYMFFHGCFGLSFKKFISHQLSNKGVMAPVQ